MVTNIDRARLLDLIEDGAQVVDVLPEREYSAQHLPDAINIPLKRFDVEATAVLRRDKPVVVY